MFTARQSQSWERRGGWGEVTMISHGVDISIATGGGEIFGVLSLDRLFFLFLFLLLFLYHIFCVGYKNSHAALAMA